MVSPDPVAAIRRAAADKTLPPQIQKILKKLAAGQEDGVRMTALLVARLRFERLIQGSLEAGAWFERDPAGFSAAFRRYHHDVPPTALFPPQEAQLFHEWQRARVED
jgi:hypothetical protein